MGAMPDRALRALASIAVATLVLAVAAAAYLHSSPAGPARHAVAPTATPRPAPIVNAVSFGDADHGAVVLVDTTSLTGAGLSSSTWLTSDGGRTWRRFVASGAVRVGLIFDSPRHAVALSVTPRGDVVSTVSTSDGGRSWQPLTAPGMASTFVNPPTFLDADNGWWLQMLGGQGFPAFAEPQPVALWRTVDGGGTWQQMAALGIPDAGAKGPLSFADPEHGLLLVTTFRTGSPTLLTTADGGATWRPAATFDSPVPGTHLWTVRLFVHGQRLVAVPVWVADAEVNGDIAGIRPGANVAFHPFVSVSDDAGRTWSPLRPGPVVAGAFHGTAAPTLDDHERLVLLDGRRLWVSGDGGATWSARAAVLPTGLEPMGPITAAPGALFVSARASPPATASELLRSRDGGSHWSVVPLPKVQA